MKNLTSGLLLLTISTLAPGPAWSALSPENVVIVVNANPEISTASRAVGDYYRLARNIPQGNVVEIYTDDQEH